MNNIPQNCLILTFLIIQFLLISNGFTYAAESPEDALSLYITAMRNHNSDPNLDFYTLQTRSMLKGLKVTPTQMDNIVKTYSDCYSPETRYNKNYSLAVVRYSPEQEHCSPWFFQNIYGNWLIDLTMMQKAIRFGPANSWHFVVGLNHGYEFAFTDWKFNSQGYPVTSGY